MVIYFGEFMVWLAIKKNSFSVLNYLFIQSLISVYQKSQKGSGRREERKSKGKGWGEEKEVRVEEFLIGESEGWEWV